MTDTPERAGEIVERVADALLTHGMTRPEARDVARAAIAATETARFELIAEALACLEAGEQEDARMLLRDWLEAARPEGQ